MSDRDYYKKLRKKVKDVMTKARYEHTLGVEFTAASLAMRYGVDIDKAEIAGLLHDCAKCIDDEDKFDDCKKYKIDPPVMTTGGFYYTLARRRDLVYYSCHQFLNWWPQ